MKYEINYLSDNPISEEEQKEFQEKIEEADKKISKELKLEIEKTIPTTIVLKRGLIDDYRDDKNNQNTKFGNYHLNNKKIGIGYYSLMEPVYKENTKLAWTRILRNCIYKAYFIENFMPDQSSFSLYKKNLIESLSSLLGNNFSEEVLYSELMSFKEEEVVNSKILLKYLIYAIFKVNGREYLANNIQTMFEKNNVIELSNYLFDKNPKEVILLLQSKLKKN